MLYRGLRRQHVLHHSPGWRRTLWQVLAGNALMGAFLWWVGGDTQRWLDMSALHRAAWMTLLVVGGAGIYFGTMYVLGLRVQASADAAHRHSAAPVGTRRMTIPAHWHVRSTAGG